MSKSRNKLNQICWKSRELHMLNLFGGLGKEKIFRNNFVTKIVLTYCEKKNCSGEREKLLKFEAEGREFANILRSL